MKDNDQTQSAADGSTALQAGRDILVHQGMTYQDVRQVAHDLFESNFYRLAAVAREEAAQRAEYITERFLEKLDKEHPEGLQQANDPGFQHALFTVQKEHAKAGDEDLGDLLVDLLVDRSKQVQRGLLQLVLDESLQTAPKLTEGQLSVLAVTFLLRYTKNSSVLNHTTLGEYLDRHVLPFAGKLAVSEASFTHLEFTGCGSTTVLVDYHIEEALLGNYTALFFKGLTHLEASSLNLSGGLDSRVFMPCMNDPTKLQVRVLSVDGLDSVLGAQGVSKEDIDKVRPLYESNLLTPSEVKEKVLEIRPAMASIFEQWSSSGMKSLSLTSVGRAIGHANVKRLVGAFGKLEIWIY